MTKITCSECGMKTYSIADVQDEVCEDCTMEIQQDEAEDFAMDDTDEEYALEDDTRLFDIREIDPPTDLLIDLYRS